GSERAVTGDAAIADTAPVPKLQSIVHPTPSIRNLCVTSTEPSVADGRCRKDADDLIVVELTPNRRQIPARTAPLAIAACPIPGIRPLLQEVAASIVASHLVGAAADLRDVPLISQVFHHRQALSLTQTPRVENHLADLAVKSASARTPLRSTANGQRSDRLHGRGGRATLVGQRPALRTREKAGRYGIEPEVPEVRRIGNRRRIEANSVPRASKRGDSGRRPRVVAVVHFEILPVEQQRSPRVSLRGDGTLPHDEPF